MASPVSPPPIDAEALQSLFEKGLGLHQQGDLAQASEIYRRILTHAPRDFDSLHLLGIIALQTRQPADAANLIACALAVAPNIAQAQFNYATALAQLGRCEDALKAYDAAILLQADYAEAYVDRAIALRHLNRHDAALASYDAALRIKPSFAEAHNNRGVTLNDLGRAQDAVASFDEAILLNPNYAEAYNNRGNALRDLMRHEDALASYDTAIRLKPDYAEAHNNRALVLTELHKPAAALASYDTAIRLSPTYVIAYLNRGITLSALKRGQEAIADFDAALRLSPQAAEAYNNRGVANSALKRHEAAIADYETALRLKPDIPFLLGMLLHTKAMVCDWKDFAQHTSMLEARIARGEKVSASFQLLALSDSPALQQKAAKIWAAAKCPARPVSRAPLRYKKHDKIRLGYFSMDFCNHAVALLSAGLFDNHDRARFEVIAFSFGLNNRDAMRQRLEGTFDQFLDVEQQTDRETVALARDMEIDIAVDLGGYTAGARTNIFAMRAAPIQVSYLGFTGTMGVPYIDYIVGDRRVIPEDQQPYYEEKIAYLPHSYMVTDSTRQISSKPMARADFGLPTGGFVFCCFNASFKFNPQIFDSWMRILRRVAGSVLWLSESGAAAMENLRKEAVARGVDAERLIFAKRLPAVEDHLARHRLADLFLDTLPFNAHTTACDALWSGLPVLTHIGHSFAGRAAASLLYALNLPELIVTSEAAYEAEAVALAQDATRLAAIREKLARHRETAPLFKTSDFTRYLETAYIRMYERHHAGLAPDHFSVDP